MLVMCRNCIVAGEQLESSSRAGGKASRPASVDSMEPAEGEQVASGRPPVIAGMPADPLKLLKRLMEQIKVRCLPRPHPQRSSCCASCRT